tara:strand:- start:375 stop:650 length:276 start_codon:yes stop_codon:yes gene_type:complete
MSQAEKHYNSIQEGILRARLIRKDLEKHPTEYYPEKVRGLNKAYVSTIKEIMRQGELYLDCNPPLLEGMEVAMIVENYRAFLCNLNNGDPS